MVYRRGLRKEPAYKLITGESTAEEGVDYCFVCESYHPAGLPCGAYRLTEPAESCRHQACPRCRGAGVTFTGYLCEHDFTCGCKVCKK